MSKQQLKLILEDGTEFIGEAFGAFNETEGEVVFNTGMVGYPESLTDPSYKNQILVCTFPLVGNYGVPKPKVDQNGVIENFESDRVHIKGLIVSDYSDEYNHYDADKSLSQWLEEYSIPGITGIDTRALTKKIREKGVMSGKIVKLTSKVSKKFHDPNKDNLVAEVGVKEPVIYGKEGKGVKTLLMLDCGMKENILRNLLARNVRIVRVPWDYDFMNSEFEYDAIFLSNGPGDPEKLDLIVEKLKKAITKNIPIVGICLGIQLLSIAAGAKTYKLKYGHRSQNQPCIDVETGRCYLTSQNHGYAVDEKTLPKNWNVWFRNANDNTVEGVKHATKPYAAVQFHPESFPGPVDTTYLFDELLKIAGVK